MITKRISTWNGKLRHHIHRSSIIRTHQQQILAKNPHQLRFPKRQLALEVNHNNAKMFEFPGKVKFVWSLCHLEVPGGCYDKSSERSEWWTLVKHIFHLKSFDFDFEVCGNRSLAHPKIIDTGDIILVYMYIRILAADFLPLSDFRLL